MTTLDRLKKIMAQTMPDTDVSNAAEDTLLSDIGVNSISMLLFVLSIEEEFGIVTDNIAPDEFVTVGDFIKYIEAQKKA